MSGVLNPNPHSNPNPNPAEDNKCAIRVCGYHLPEGAPAFDIGDPDLMRSERVSASNNTVEPAHPHVLVMDQATQSLSHLVSSQRVAGHNVAEVRRLFGKLAQRVAQLHQGGVLHFDLKPRNVLLRDMELLLCDLDAAMMLQSGAY